MQVLDKGHLELVDHMGSDKSVVRAARVSYANADWASEELDDRDGNLIKYLAKHGHNSPFYHPQAQFVVKSPLSVRNQWFKHKVGTAENSESFRYVNIEPEFYVPDHFRTQSRINKQASADPLAEEKNIEARMAYVYACKKSFAIYQGLLDIGVAREQAREVLPLSTYTSFIWTASLAACAHFIRLRDEDGAQQEIRQYAKAMRELLEPIFPVSLKALVG